MFIRFFAATDMPLESELGEAALAWVPFMLALDVPVRVAAARVADPAGWFGKPTPWMKHADLLMTPMEGDFVNLVCTLPEDWARLWTSHRNELLRKNVLLCPFTAPVENPKLIAAAKQYDELIVPTEADAELWRNHGADPRVLKPTADRLEDFRSILGL